MPTPLALRRGRSAGRTAGKARLPDSHLAIPTAALRMLWRWVVRSGQRKVLRELAREERLLSDIGLDRERALREAAKPFWRR